MDSDALEGHLQQRLRRGRPGQQFDEPAEDGSPRIPSLVSVWLISQVGHAVGRQKVVSLVKGQEQQGPQERRWRRPTVGRGACRTATGSGSIMSYALQPRRGELRSSKGWGAQEAS